MATNPTPTQRVLRMTSLNKYLAELVGTFVLVFGGVGSAVLGGPKVGNVGIALAFGLALLAMVYTIGPISGCHINPAVTVGLALHRKIGPTDAVAYIVAQIVGAIIAAGLLLAIARGGRGATTRPWRGWGPMVMAFTRPVIMPWARPSSPRPS